MGVSLTRVDQKFALEKIFLGKKILLHYICQNLAIKNVIGRNKKTVLFAQFQIATDWTNWFQCIWSSDETTNQQTNNFFSSKKQRTSKKCSKNRIDSTNYLISKKCAFINIVRNDDILMTTYQKQKNHFKDWINSIPKLDLYNIIFGSRNFIARHSHFSSKLSKKST